MWAEVENFSPDLCNDFANSGPWLEMPANITWLVHPDRNSIKVSGGCGAPPYKSYSMSDESVPVEYKYQTTISILPNIEKVHERDNEEFLKACISDELQYFYRDATKIVFGKSEYANVSEIAAIGNPERKYFGQTQLADNKTAHHFLE